ncbi:MAG: HEPN domain-containing protein [Elusimicrobiota bacterium]
MNTEKDIIKYWSATSKQDFETAELLYKNKKYQHALFFCHLSIEKLLKALVIKSIKTAPPLIHDLVRLAEKTGIEFTGEMMDKIAEISTFNIQARYDDYKLSFYKKATSQFTSKYMTVTKGILKWLIKYL